MSRLVESSSAVIVPAPPATEPRAAYVHVPFCAHRCGYCNFTLIAGRDDLIESYLSALGKELNWLQRPRAVDTLFIGGGTPTHLAGPQLARLLTLVREWFPPSDGAEFSVEANPIDVTPERVAVLAAGGVNRVSLGAQSFQPLKLAALERDHGPAEIAAAVRLVRAAGMAVSLDLIFAAPGETLAGWQNDLEAALALDPDHVSTYGLTYERGTTFWNRHLRGELRSLDEELERAMYEWSIDRLGSADFDHYEVSNFARPGHRCRHNEVYWAGQEYFAAGPGAARYVNGWRETNHRSTTTWLQRVEAGESPVADREQLSAAERARETLVLGLRRRAGVERGSFAVQSGFELDELAGAQITRYVELGLLVDDGQWVRLSHSGLMVSDAMWPAILRGDGS